MAYKKLSTLTDELGKTLEQIEKTENSLVALKAHKKDLEDRIADAEIRELRNAIRKNGKSLDDIMALIAQ